MSQQGAKHTPGEWSSAGHRQIVGPRGVICEVWSGPCASLEEADANEALIAAAPDMLDALLCIAGDADGQHADPLRTLEHIRATARAAIAKATGGAQ